jgi:aminopeptidase N
MPREVDPLVHPALMDPRQMAGLDIYELFPPLERGEIKAEPHYAPGRPFDIQHTRLELDIDQDKGEVAGRATITLRPFALGIDEIELHAAEMSFDRVTLKNGRRARAAPQFKTYEDRIWIALDRRYSEGEQITLILDYTCRPRTGLHFVRPDAAYPNEPSQVWSQGEDEENHYWFPCFDHPSQKMTSEVILTVGERQTALSNGKLVSVKHNKKARTKTYHYSHEYPHPTYLVSIAVGDYEEIKDAYKGRPVRYYVYRDRAKDATALFRKTPDMIKRFSELFSYDYPYPKYDQVLVSEFLFGAMENTTATTISDRALLDEEAARDVSNEDLVSHELAHQWWGNIVTCKDWAHLWLNEGFATYCEALYKEHDAGADEARFYLMQEYMAYIQEDRTTYRRPVVTNRYTYPTEMFDRHTYQKGGLVLDMLRFVLGDEAFFKSIRHYLKKFEWKSVETDDLRRCVEEVTGQNLEWFFDQWLYKSGYPEFEVTQEYDRAQKLLRLAVRQVQEVNELTPVFKMPVEIEVITSRETLLFRVVVERAEQDFYFNVESVPLAVNFDKGNRVLKRLDFNRPVEDSVYLLKHGKDVTARIRAARELGAFSGDAIIKALDEAITLDGFFAVKVAAVSALGEISRRADYTDRSQNLLIEHYNRSQDARVRRACVWGLGAFNAACPVLAPAAIEKYRRAFATLVRAFEQDESIFVAATAVRAIGNIGRAIKGAEFDKAFEVLMNGLERKSYQDVIRSAVFDALAFMREERGIDIALEWAAYGRPQSARVGAITALGKLAKEHKEDRERVVKRLIELTKDKSARVRIAAIRALGRAADLTALGALRDSRNAEAVSQVKAAAHRAVVRLEEAAMKKEAKQ